MKKILLLCLSLIAFFSLSAQNINGSVYGINTRGEEEALEYATVYWHKGTTVATTAKGGRFSLAYEPLASRKLIASYVGFANDTITVADTDSEIRFVLKPHNNLDAVVLTGRRAGNYISSMAPAKTEVITASGLCKMACCNLAESFENSASVTVGYTDAITGARQIRLLGLGGAYTQMLEESQPTMRGLLSTFGLSYIPGQWLESIQISKGAGSVAKGYECITGQINMEYRKPTTEQPLFVNAMVSNHLRSELNIVSSLQLNPAWSTVLLTHTSHNFKKTDMNHDGFLDEPLSHQYNVSNRWLHAFRNGAQLRFGWRALYEERTGGQKDYRWNGGAWNADPDFALWTPQSGWGNKIVNKGAAAYVKLGLPLAPEDETQVSNENYVRPNVAFVADYTYHQLDSRFGLHKYNGKQHNLFFNAIFMASSGSSHKYTVGISAAMDKYEEALVQRFATDPLHPYKVDPSRTEKVAGVYGEYTLTLGEKFLLIAGLREDYNSEYGWLFTPKVNLKYNFTEDFIFRASAGKGYRSPNIVADNLGMLSTQRMVVVEGKPDMEEAWICGLNLTYAFPLGNVEKAQLSFDYFHTSFARQLLVDQEARSGEVCLYNLEGRSYTDTYQADFNCTPFKGFTAALTFRYNDSKVELRKRGLTDRPLMSKFKGVVNLQYATNMNIWTFDFTAQLNGPARLPDLHLDPLALVASEYGYSPVFPMFFAQVTRKFKGVDVYVGCDNIGNYMQKHPIMSADHPYDADFNASVIWGPLMGRTLYAGFRITVWK